MRTLSDFDAPRCAELETQLFPGDDPWPAEAFREAFHQAHTIYIGEDDPETGTLIGYAGIAAMGPADAPEFEVHTIGVDPAYQRRGIGGRLMAELLRIADRYHAPIFLEVRTDNEPAITLYENLGFQRLGVRRNYYQPSGADAYTMKREAKPQP